MTRILIVDDEPSYRGPLCSVLSSEGFEVRAVATTQEALALAESFAPDVLIVDWMLRNRQDGLVLAATLQASRPELRIIVITGYPTARLEARIREFVGIRYLIKPFRLSDLLDAIREVTDGAA